MRRQAAVSKPEGRVDRSGPRRNPSRLIGDIWSASSRLGALARTHVRATLLSLVMITVGYIGFFSRRAPSPRLRPRPPPRFPPGDVAAWLHGDSRRRIPPLVEGS